MGFSVPLGFTCQNRKIAAVAISMFALGIVATAARVVIQYQVPGPFDPSAQGMCDFHNGIYFPTRALMAGVSPYGDHYAETYPVARQIPFFSPGILVLHAPLAVLPLHTAEVTYFLFSVALVLAIATVCVEAAGIGRRVEWVVGLGAAIVFSRAGHVTLFDGYFTLELVLATLIAICFAKDRPVVSALALAVVSAKPTFILPLGILLLARGNYRALVLGAVVSVFAAALPMIWLAYHEGIRESGAVDLGAGFGKLAADIDSAQQIHMNMEDESPVHSWTRLDLLATVSKWVRHEPDQLTHLAVMALILAWPSMILFRRFRHGIDDGLSGATGTVIIVMLLTSLYHQSYDALVLFAPAAGLLGGRVRFWKTRAAGLQWAFLVLLLLPPYNYLSTRLVLSRFGFDDVTFRVFTSINGVALALLAVLMCWQMRQEAAVRASTEPPVR